MLAHRPLKEAFRVGFLLSQERLCAFILFCFDAVFVILPLSLFPSVSGYWEGCDGGHRWGYCCFPVYPGFPRTSLSDPEAPTPLPNPEQQAFSFTTAQQT